MTIFLLSVTIPDDLLDSEQAALASGTLHNLAANISRWCAIPTSHRLRDRTGKVIGWIGTEEIEDAPTWQDVLAAEPSEELACLRDVDT